MRKSLKWRVSLNKINNIEVKMKAKFKKFLEKRNCLDLYIKNRKKTNKEIWCPKSDKELISEAFCWENTPEYEEFWYGLDKEWREELKKRKTGHAETKCGDWTLKWDWKPSEAITHRTLKYSNIKFEWDEEMVSVDRFKALQKKVEEMEGKYATKEDIANLHKKINHDRKVLHSRIDGLARIVQGQDGNLLDRVKLLEENARYFKATPDNWIYGEVEEKPDRIAELEDKINWLTKEVEKLDGCAVGVYNLNGSIDWIKKA